MAIMEPGSGTLTRDRLLLVLAAVLWSSGSFFMRVLREPTGLGLDEPQLTPLQIAFFRGIFAGAILVPLLRPAQIRLRPSMFAMVACFGLMSGLYLSALGLGQAANAILLQNTAPFWVYIVGVYFLGERGDSRTLKAILVGVAAMLLIVVGNWIDGPPSEGSVPQSVILMMGAGSGAMYACVVLFLRSLRAESSAWLMVLNLFGGAGVLLVYVFIRFGPDETERWLSTPTLFQLAVLAVFGAVQMATPYWLFARGLKTVNPHEAGMITLLEPVLNPVWAYLIAPEKETPTIWTAIGGGVLLSALAWRYLPRRTPRPSG